ncbi:MAG: helix-turn-helix domain-containing protein [Planctomycetes bacterium]|nr:helix-turn-helix domain-containing protein [Planctomycetota bacterium]MCC7170455.1 helix-turn-helix domain-containing protein [Planctomycetota bacterium]
METETAVRAFSALAQDSRLAVFRALVRAGPTGTPAGALAESLRIPASTLSFHLQHLCAAGLATSVRSGRSLLYSLREQTLRELIWFLGEDCCQGRADLCELPTARIDARRLEAVTASDRPRVLFVCSRNSARSQIAEAILRRDAGDHFEVCSAGLSPREIDPMTRKVIEERGLPTGGLTSKDLGQFLGKSPIHVAIVVCEAANDHCPKIVPFAARLLFWPFVDPVTADGAPRRRLQRFREVRDAIEERIARWLATRPWEQLRDVERRASLTAGTAVRPKARTPKLDSGARR